MKSITGLGKYLFAVPMLIFGVFHFMGANDMAGMVPLPGGVFWVYLTGAALIAAAISIFIGKLDKLAAVLLALMLLIFVFTIHLGGAMSGDQSAVAGFLKDLALAGGALMYAHSMAKDNAVIG